VKRIVALPVLFLAVVVVPYFFSCVPPDGGEGGEGTPTTSATATGQVCEPLICDDPGAMTFSQEYVIGTTITEPMGQSMTQNGCGAPVDATLEFGGDATFWGEPMQQTIEPAGTVDWFFHFDWVTLIDPGAVDGTATITATDGTHTGSCTYNLHLDVLEPPPLQIQLEDITVEYQIGTECLEPIGSGTVTNNTTGGGEGWTEFSDPAFFADPMMSQIPPGGTQEFFVFMDCIMWGEAGQQTSDFTLAADCAEGAAEQTVQITVDVIE